jgi:hypothetical protein
MKKSKIIFIIIFLISISCSKKDFWNWNLIGSPIVSDLRVVSNTLQSFKLQANFKDFGKDKNAVLGFIISKTIINPSITDCDTLIQLNNNDKGIKSITLDWFSSGELNCRAFIRNKIDTVYSNSFQVQWIGSSLNLPSVNTNNISNVGFFDVYGGAIVTSNGGLNLSRVGVIISTNANPNLLNSLFVAETNSSDQITYHFTGLNDNTTYYVRGFAENLAGISYASNIKFFTTKKYYDIGELGPAGGLIFFHKEDTTGGWNFMECYPTEISTALPWSFDVNQQLSLQTSLGSGEANTQIIVNSIGFTTSDYAAKYCFMLSFGGQTDWFLPSRDELITIYQNLFSSNLGSFINTGKYWTSSNDIFYNQNAWCQKMQVISGSINSISELKSVYHKIRPVRCF